MIRRLYGITLLILFFGFIVFLNVYEPEKFFNLEVNYDQKSVKSKGSKKLVVEQSIKGVYLVDSQKDDTNWELWAESGLSSSASSSWRFNNVKVHFYSKDRKVYKVTSGIGLIDLKEKKMIFESDIFIEAPNGYYMKASTLEYNFKDELIFTNEPVEIDTNKNKVREPLKFKAQKMTVSLIDSKIKLKKIESIKTIKGRKKIKIKSDEAILSGASYRVEYKKNVKLQGLDFKISSEIMRLYISRKSKKIKNLTALGRVKVESGKRVGTSGVANINFNDEVIIMLKSPKLVQGQDVLYGEKIIFYNKTKSVSVKKARAKVDKNTLENYNEPIKGQ